MSDDKALPKDSDSDYSLPGRYEESNPYEQNNFSYEQTPPKPKNKGIWIMILSLVIVSAIVFPYYFMNQNEIDSQIIQNTLNLSTEEKLAHQYGVGEYGSDHEHAAIAVFVMGEQIHFGIQQFQLASKYIHFENHNPYLIHKHATDVPLEMLFSSIEMKVTQDCIILNYESPQNSSGEFCTTDNESLRVFVNGQQHFADISQYEIRHNDRILISFGAESVAKQLQYLDSLEIFDIPQKRPDYTRDEFTI